MEESSSFFETKARLEGRINELDSERNSLAIQIPVLKERLASLRLEEKARSLETEISALHSEKALIEEEISRYHSTSRGDNLDSGPSPDPFPTADSVQDIGQKVDEESTQAKEDFSIAENQEI